MFWYTTLTRDRKQSLGALSGEELKVHWLKCVGSQMIGQVELYPLLLVRHALSALLHNRRILYFIDNDAARDGLIKGHSSSPSSQILIEEFFSFEMLQPTIPWFARVPSFSNPADLPSRGELQLASSTYQAQVVDLGVLPEGAKIRLLAVG